MHRCLQFGMCENPASDRRHGSRSVVQEHSVAAASRHDSHQQGIVVGSDSVRVAQGFATGQRREEAGHAISVARSTNALCNTWTNSSADQHALSRMGPTEGDTEFEPLLDVVEAAPVLGLNSKTLRVKARHGVIVGIQIGRIWRLRASVLNRWQETTTDSRRR